MASIWRHPKSKYWTACFTDAEGKRRKRSTRTTSRTEADRLAHKFEEAARRKQTKRTARRVISDIYESLVGEPLPGETIQTFFDRWVRETGPKVASGTHRKYADERTRFLRFLGEKAKLDMDTLNRGDIVSFQSDMAANLSVGTSNTALKIIRVALNEAHRQGLIDSNPASAVKILSQKAGDSIRRPFTLPEIKRILKLADEEWKGIVLLGFYTGQRLQDIVTATWTGIDLTKGTWTFVTKKTNQDKELPLAGPVLRYLKSRKAKRHSKAHVFPRLSQSVHKKNHVAAVNHNPLRGESGMV